MKAIQIHSFGTPDVLSVDEVSRPEPAEHEIVVETRAAAYNPMDALFREGELEPDKPFPVIPGGDIAGVVDEVGSAVEALEPGDEVYGTTNRHNLGAYAEYTLATPETVVKKPESVDFAHAAAIPTVGLTARQAVYDIADVSADDQVLVHGGAGGVGSFAVQLAANRGATVIATAAPDDHDFVQSLGAKRVIDYDSSFENQVADIDVVVDPVGGDTRTRSWEVLAQDGVLVTLTYPDPTPEAEKFDREGVLFFVDITRDALISIAEAFDAGELTVTVGDSYPLEAAERVHELAQSDHAPQGKLVFVPNH